MVEALGRWGQAWAWPLVATSGPAVASGLAAFAAGAGALAFLGVQDHLAEPDRARGQFHALVVGDELQRRLEAERPRRREPLEDLRRRGPHVGLLLLLGDVDVHVVGTGVLADDHAFVHLGGRSD